MIPADLLPHEDEIRSVEGGRPGPQPSGSHPT